MSSVHAAFSYEGAARNAVLALKFRSGRYLVSLMGELLSDALAQQPLQADIIVPVPLAPSKLRGRGFNQARLLAERVTPDLSDVVKDALERTDRPAQSTLSAAQRMANLTGAFCCPDPSNVRGKRVLLIDDVVTTGATASACADTLAQAGASRISVLAFARDL